VQFSELQKLSNLDLDLGSSRSHTGAHIQSRSTHTPNQIKIGKTFYGRTDRPEFQFIGSLLGDDLKIMSPAHVVQWSNHLGAMCSRARRSQWPRIDSSLGPGASAY